MRNLIIIISVLFVAIIAVSFFYFSNLGQKDQPEQVASDSTDVSPDQVESVASNGLLWTFDLNGGAVTKPSVWMHTDTNRFILVQDAYHILHAISPDGLKLWNAQLPGPIVGGVQQLADRSLVFATAERLYRIDTEGDPLPGFSLKLPQQATQGVLAIRQQTDDGAVHIDVAGSRQLLSYDGRGKLLRRQARAASTQGEDSTQTTGTLTIDTSDMPAGCGPFTYIGPLKNNDGRYLLCGKEDRKLYCYQLLP